MKSFIRVFRNTAAVLAFVLILAFAAANYKIVTVPGEKYLHQDSSFPDLKDAVTEGYTSDELKLKHSFIELNGLFNRITGRRVYHGVALMNDGMLTYDTLKDVDTAPAVEALTKDAEFLKKQGIPFLYVQAPYKLPTGEDLLPAGAENYRNEVLDRLLAELDAADIQTLDLREGLASTREQVEKTFYRTDHHWNTDGAFAAFGLVMERMQEVLHTDLDLTYTDVSLWERHSLKNWFLGSHGKRVGTLFAGTDDLIWYTPRFETSMSCIVPHHKEIFFGDFEKANIRSQYIEKKDYYGYNPYCVYIGGDYPLVEHRNADAPNHMKILVIKDSFTLPFQAFLSTAFSEVDVIDPRHYTASSLAEYIAWTRPDCVMMLTSYPDQNYYDWKIRAPQEAAPEVLLTDHQIELPAMDKTHHYSQIPVTLEPGATYRISYSSATVNEGETDGFSVLVFDFSGNSIARHNIFDVAYGQRTGGDSWTFKVPEAETGNEQFKLLVYSGIHGSTQGIGMTISGITVEKIA